MGWDRILFFFRIALLVSNACELDSVWRMIDELFRVSLVLMMNIVVYNRIKGRESIDVIELVF